MNILESHPVVTCLHSQVYKRDSLGDRARIRTSVLLYVQTLVSITIQCLFPRIVIFILFIFNPCNQLLHLPCSILRGIVILPFGPFVGFFFDKQKQRQTNKNSQDYE
jgi:hypothetical protein